MHIKASSSRSNDVEFDMGDTTLTVADVITKTQNKKTSPLYKMELPL